MADFDRGVILDGYEYNLDVWDVMEESKLFMEGRIMGMMCSTGVKKFASWLTIRVGF